MSVTRAAILLPLWLSAACLLVLVPTRTLAASANSSVTLTVDSNVCSAFEFDDLPQKFHFDVKLNALVIAGCNSSKVV